MARFAVHNAIVLLCVMGLLACAAPGRTAPEVAPWGESLGVTWIYAELSDLPADIRFDLLDVELESDAGARIAVPRVAPDRGPLERRTTSRLIAAGPVPFGQYSAIHLTLDSAILDRSNMDVTLAIADNEVRLPVSFSARKGRVTLLRFGPRGDALAGGGGEYPARFSAWVGDLPAAGRLEAIVQADPPAIVFVDRLRQAVVGAIPSTRRLTAVDIDLLRLRVYATSPDTDEILAFSIPEGNLVARGWTAAGDEPTDLALTPDGETLVVGYRGSSTVGILNPERLTERARVRSGESLESIRLDPSGQIVFTFDPLSDRVLAIDIERRSLTAAIQVDPQPFTGRFDVEGRRLYVIHRHSPNVAVIDAERRALDTTVFVGHGTSAVAIDPATDRVLFALRDPESLEIFEPTALLPVDRQAVDLRIRDLRVDAETGRIWVIPESGDRIWLFDRGSSVPDRGLELPGRPVAFSTRDRR